MASLLDRMTLCFSVAPEPTPLVNSLFFQQPRWPVYHWELLSIVPIPSTGAGIHQVIQHKLPWISNNGWANGGVLFPVSSRSMGSISSAFPPAQIECLTVYRTILNPRVVEACAVYIFTSPSNAEAFLLQNTIPGGAKVIAKGTSTQEFLQQHGIESTYFTDESIHWEEALAPWVNP